jgi:hypothetical protein
MTGYLNNSEDVFSEDIRKKTIEKFDLTKLELKESDVKRLIKKFNLSIVDWVLNNADGYKPHKNCGILVISKYYPKIFQDDKEITIEKILNATYIPEWKKKLYIKKYEGITTSGPKKNYLQTYFYDHNILWFNYANCDFKKARLYKFAPSRDFLNKLWKKIKEGKQYVEWQATDFALVGENSVSFSVKAKLRRKAKKLKRDTEC